MLYVMVPVLAVWMLGCVYAGYKKRFGLFAIILVIGISLNTLWMVLGLNAKPFSPNAMVAHAGIFLYAVSAVGLGFLIGRVSRAFRASRVDVDE